MEKISVPSMARAQVTRRLGYGDGGLALSVCHTPGRAEGTSVHRQNFYVPKKRRRRKVSPCLMRSTHSQQLILLRFAHLLSRDLSSERCLTPAHSPRVFFFWLPSSPLRVSLRHTLCRQSSQSPTRRTESGWVYSRQSGGRQNGRPPSWNTSCALRPVALLTLLVYEQVCARVSNVQHNAFSHIKLSYGGFQASSILILYTFWWLTFERTIDTGRHHKWRSRHCGWQKRNRNRGINPEMT